MGDPQNEFQRRYDLIRQTFEAAFKKYYTQSCQCAFPRYRQLMAIDCVDTGKSFSCYETELLIEMSKPYFHWSPDGTSIAPEWTCKKCGSVYSYEWADFSIYVNRQTVKVTALHTAEIGKSALKPVPLFLGLSGHSFPPQTEFKQADFEEFEEYVLEIE